MSSNLRAPAPSSHRLDHCQIASIRRKRDLSLVQVISIEGASCNFAGWGTRGPGKPTDNAFMEANNSKLRSEFVDTHWFLSLEVARDKLGRGRRQYKEERPHNAIGNIPPIMPTYPTRATSPPDPGQVENSRP